MAEDASTPRSPSVGQHWRGGEGAPVGRRTARRGPRFVALTVFFLIVLSFIAVVILYLRTRPGQVYFLTITIGDYNAPLPACAFARQDGELLKSRFRGEVAVTKDKELLRNQFNALRLLKVDHVVIHLAALAVARDGKVFVLPGDARIDEPATWQDVRELIDAMKECKAKHKLLILDLARPMVDPQLGILTDRVAGELVKLLEADPPTYHVFLPCSADQHSSVSDILQCSSFAHYLSEGLAGKADSGDQLEVSVKELFTYVAGRVDRWAQVNRGVRQEPRWFGQSLPYFPLVKLGSEADDTEPVKPPAYPSVLKKTWEKRDELIGKGAARLAPRQLRLLDTGLLRHENRWRGGAIAGQDAETLDDDTQDVLRGFEVALQVRHAPPCSLALAGVSTDIDLAAKVNRDLIKAAAEAADDKALAQAAKDLAKQLAGLDDKNPVLGSWALIDALGKIVDPTPAHLTIVEGALAHLADPKKPALPLVEGLYVNRLARYTRRKDPTPEGRHIRAMLQAMRAREEVIAALDACPEFLPWGRPALADADRKRRLDEQVLLWAPDRVDWPRASADLTALEAIYARTKKELDALAAARRQTDLALAKLPGFAALLCDWPDEDPEHEDEWFGAAEETVSLLAVFGGPPSGSAAPLVDAPTQKLTRHLNALDRLLNKRLEAIDKDDSAKNPRRLHCLLRNPLLTADQRDSLVKQERQRALERNQKTDEAELPLTRALVERSPVELRARMSLAVLRLAGCAAAPALAELALKNRLAGRDLDDLEKGLRQSWGARMRESWEAAAVNPAGDRLNRFLPPWDQHSKDASLEHDWSVRLKQEERAAFLAWLGDAYRAESNFWDAAQRNHKKMDERETRDFYKDAANALRR